MIGKLMAVSEDVHQAMVARGYRGDAKVLAQLRLSRIDLLYATAVAVFGHGGARWGQDVSGRTCRHGQGRLSGIGVRAGGTAPTHHRRRLDQEWPPTLSSKHSVWLNCVPRVRQRVREGSLVHVSVSVVPLSRVGGGATFYSRTQMRYR